MTARSFPAVLLCLLPVLACGPKKPAPQPPEPEAEAEPAPPSVDPVPADFGALTPQIVVADIQAAVDFYTAAFGAQTVYAMPGPEGSLMHAEIMIGDSVVMIDLPNPNMKDPMTLGGSPITLMLYVDDADVSFDQAVKAGAVVNMPMLDQFWGDRYGQIIDPFGHAWALATHIEDLTNEQLEQRAAMLPPPPKKGKKNRPSKKKPKWASVVGTPATEKVPADYHTVTMALTVSNAAEAIDFYTKAFGATERSRLLTPDGKVMHAEVVIGGDILMIADEIPDSGATSAATLGGSPVMIHHYVPDVDATFGAATGAGGQQIMPLDTTFWGDRYGVVVDPAGLPWGLASHVEDVTPEQMKERMQAAMGGEGGEAAPAEGGEATSAEGEAAPAEPAA